ncbi:AtpZ/AtpI family protein [Sphingorhabdus sp.]|jgi:ATP synthase protein I|uniref:AtpZ/AtpI family protein n=1 Tax=Sphingorhabdus sp. TaxID=1902408 RepID=UPI003D819A25
MTSDNSGQDGKGKSDARLDSLDMQLKAARKAEAERAGKDQVPAKGMRQGNRVLTELIAGPAGGALVGWLLDRLLGVAPALLLVCMFLGIAVAFRNIIKISAERPD